MKRIKSTHGGTNNSRNNNKKTHLEGLAAASIRKVNASANIIHVGSMHMVKRVANCDLCGLGMSYGQKREKPGRSRRPPHTLPGTQQGTNTKPEKK